jgi:hypothetical protein
MRPHEWGCGRLDHGTNAQVNLSWISLTMDMRQWSCLRYVRNRASRDLHVAWTLVSAAPGLIPALAGVGAGTHSLTALCPTVYTGSGACS